MCCVTIEPLNKSPCDDWDRLVKELPEATFFHRSAWKAVIESSFGQKCYFLQAFRRGQLRGVLPLVHVRSRLFGDSLISTGYTVYGGPIAERSADVNALDQAAIRLARQLKVGYLEYRLQQPSQRQWARNSSLYATFCRTLLDDDDSEMRALPPGRRNRIRRAQALGLSCEVDTDTQRFYQMYAINKRDLGTPVYPKHYFDTLLNIFQDDLQIISVVRSKQVLSSVISFYFHDQVLPYYAGGINEARRTSANDFMYWELMRFARQRGARRFDFGRSKRGTGAFNYKTYWGFTPQSLHYEYFLLHGSKTPNLSPANPKYASLVACWKRLPLPLATWLGPHISRSLG